MIINRDNRENKKQEELGVPGNSQLKLPEEKRHMFNEGSVERREVSEKSELQRELRDVKSDELQKNGNLRKGMKDISGRNEKDRS